MAQENNNSRIHNFNNMLKDHNITLASILNGEVDITQQTPFMDDVIKGIHNIFSDQTVADDLINKVYNQIEHNKANFEMFYGSPDEYKKWSKQKVQAEAMKKNIETIELFMNDYDNQRLSNVLNNESADFFTPYMKPKTGNPMYSTVGLKEHVIGFTGVAKSFRESGKEMTNTIMENFENSSSISMNGEFSFEGEKIWTGINSVTTNSAYGGDQTSVQGQIESFQNFQEKINQVDSPSNKFITFDIETFGSMSTEELFQVNEIAVQEWNRDPATGKHKEGSLASWLLRPTEKTESKMLSVIEEIKQNPYKFATLTPDMQRSVMDLTKYSTNQTSIDELNLEPAKFIKSDGSVNVIHNNIQEADGLYKNGKVDIKRAIDHMDVLTTHMMSGMENLKGQGKESEKIMNLYSTFVNDNQDKTFISHNGEAFDLPGLKAFGKELGVEVQDPKNHVDWLKVLRTVSFDSTELHERLGADMTEGFKKGTLTLEQISHTLFKDNEEFKLLNGQAHQASYDVGRFGLGGVVNETKDLIQEILNDAMKENGIDNPLILKGSDLELTENTLKKGQKFLAIGGTKNFSPTLQDVQVEYIDGKPVLKEFGNNVFNAKSLYELEDIRKVDGKEVYIADFLNLETGEHTMIERSGENARLQLSQLINQHLEVADDMDERLIDGLRAVKKKDAARRHYDQLFGIAQGGTKGYSAARRMISNIQILNENFTGELSELTPELKQSLTEKMNFNSLLGGEFNKAEVEKFWEFAPRLRSEEPFISQFMERIDTELPRLEGGLLPSEYRNQNLKKSLMLRQMMDELNYEVGGEPIGDRAPLPHEKRLLKYNDRLDSGREKSINLTNAKSAQSGITRQIYAGATEEAEERYLTLISSLQESGVMTKKESEAIVENYHQSEGMTPYTHSQVLAKQLAENENILDMVEAQNLSVKVASLEARDELLFVQKEQVENIMDKGSGMGQGLFGTKGMLPKGITDIFEKLDHEHELTKLNVRNKEAVEGVLDRIERSPYSKNMATALTMSEDGRSLFINMFSEYDAEVVLGQLTDSSRKMSDKIDNLLRIEIPILMESGTLRYNGQYINAHTMIIKENGLDRVLNSQDRFVEALDQETLNSALGTFRGGDQERAQVYIERKARQSINDLSGTKQNAVSENDSYVSKNSSADIGKQSHVVAHGLVHEYYNINPGTNGDIAEFQKRGLQDNAFIDGDRKNGLKTYIPESAITPSGLSFLENHEQAYVKKVMGVDNYKSGVKSDNARLTVSTMDFTQNQFHGILSPSTRDNSVQLENSYFYSKEMQEELNERGVDRLHDTSDRMFVSTKTSATTSQREALDERISAGTGSRMSVDIKTVWMQENEIVDKVMQMKETDEGKALLEKEGILKEGELNHARLPQTYEQQMIVNQELQELMVMRKTKFLDIPENLRIAEDLIDVGTGEVKTGASVKSGQIIAQAHDIYGNAIEGTEIRYEGHVNGSIAVKDGRLAIDYLEDVHKVQIGYEKGTFSGGGVKGFSSEFLHALTGVRGVGAVLAPDVAKHSDHDSITGGKLRRLALTINEATGEEKERLIATTSKYDIGASLEKVDGTYRFVDTIKESGAKKFDMNQVNDLMTEVGIDDSYLVQPISMSDVELYGETVGGRGGKVSYSTRELLLLKNQGLTAMYDFVEDEISEQTRRSGAANQVRAMSAAQRSMIYGADLEGHEGKIWSAHDFEQISKLDNNKLLNKGTVLDSKMIQEIDGYDRSTSKTHGFVLELPKGEGIRIVSEAQQPLTHIVLPYAEFDEKLQEKGETMYKSKIQSANTRIIEAARRLEEAKYASTGESTRAVLVKDASEKLQNAIQQTESKYVDELFTSKGFANRHALRARMPNSSAGLTKIVSADWEQYLSGDHYTMMSSVDAKKIDVDQKFAEEFGLNVSEKKATLYDVLKHSEETGKDYFAMSSRYPTFHNDAAQITKLKMSEDLKPGYQIISSAVGDLLRADSDGDYNNLVSVADQGVQKELKTHYDMLSERRDELYDNILAKSNEENNMWNSSIFGENEDGKVTVYDGRDERIRYTEVTAKHAKGLVGYASNMDYRYNQLANMFYDKTTEEGAKKIATIENFFSGRYGISQRIISAKHKKDSDIVLGVNGGEKLISAISNRDWAMAEAIDRDFLGGYFSNTEQGNMGAAFETIREMEANMPAEIFGGHGIRTGLRSSMATGEQAAQFLAGESTQYSPENEFSKQLLRINDTEEKASHTYEQNIAQQQVYTERGQSRPVLDEVINYREPASNSRVREALEGITSSKGGMGLLVAGGLGMAALTFSNTSSAVTAFKEDRPHNQADYNSVEAGGQMDGGTQNLARVEMNGQGLSGMEVSINGRSPGTMSDKQLQGLMSGALSSAGVNANLTVNVQDDSSSINKEWLQEQFTQLITNGRV